MHVPRGRHVHGHICFFSAPPSKLKAPRAATRRGRSCGRTRCGTPPAPPARPRGWRRAARPGRRPGAPAPRPPLPARATGARARRARRPAQQQVQGQVVLGRRLPRARTATTPACSSRSAAGTLAHVLCPCRQQRQQRSEQAWLRSSTGAGGDDDMRLRTAACASTEGVGRSNPYYTHTLWQVIHVHSLVSKTAARTSDSSSRTMKAASSSHTPSARHAAGPPKSSLPAPGSAGSPPGAAAAHIGAARSGAARAAGLPALGVGCPCVARAPAMPLVDGLAPKLGHGWGEAAGACAARAAATSGRSARHAACSRSQPASPASSCTSGSARSPCGPGASCTHGCAA